MFKFLFFLIILNVAAFSQTDLLSPEAFKGDHFVIYNKCKTAVLFCESTQQVYTFCGANKNCQGLYVNPGDTFYLNYEDKAQIKAIVSDITFQGYFATVLGHTFQPVQTCIPPQALQIAIPLNAVPGSSFQINAENPDYDPSENPNLPLVPLPIYIYIGGQQPASTTTLSDFTACPVMDTSAVDVSVKEIVNTISIALFPNPANEKIQIESSYPLNKLKVVMSNALGNLVNAEIKDNLISLTEVKNGVYYVSVYFNEAYAGTKKLIVLKE